MQLVHIFDPVAEKLAVNFALSRRQPFESNCVGAHVSGTDNVDPRVGLLAQCHSQIGGWRGFADANRIDRNHAKRVRCKRLQTDDFELGPIVGRHHTVGNVPISAFFTLLNVNYVMQNGRVVRVERGHPAEVDAALSETLDDGHLGRIWNVCVCVCVSGIPIEVEVEVESQVVVGKSRGVKG